MSTPLQTYAGLYAHVLKLTGRAIGRRWPYLFIAPLIGIPYSIISDRVAVIASANTGAGLVGGFLLSLLRAAAISCVLYGGRAIVEQRRLTFDDLSTGFSAFLWDIVTIFFVIWIGTYVIGSFAPGLLLPLYVFVFVGMPLFEVVALTSASSYGVFSVAWSFVRRDAGPWLAGQIPMLLLIAVFVAGSIGIGLVTINLSGMLGRLLNEFGRSALALLLCLVAFVYRGILYLTLDNTSPRARAERFGGAPSPR